MKELLLQELNQLSQELFSISDDLYAHPEYSMEEVRSSKVLADFLKNHGFETTLGIADIPTAFRAVWDSGKPGPVVGLLCEYDALPDIGHGCCHNIIGTMSAGAAVSLSKIADQTGGKIVVYGTPGEEIFGGKVLMARAGVFDELDVAMILHPNSKTYASGSSLAMRCMDLFFTGKSAHAAAAPEEGINALNGVIEVFNGINALRQHVTSDVRLSGYIFDGGTAGNVIPDKAGCQIHCRAASRARLNEVYAKVERIAEGAALMTGASLKIVREDVPYDDMITNEALSAVFNENLRQAGISEINPPSSELGSIDMGNVSYVVPSIHPWILIADGACKLHTRELADFTITEAAHETLLTGATALAYTGYDVLTDPALLAAVKEEFINRCNR